MALPFSGFHSWLWTSPQPLSNPNPNPTPTPTSFPSSNPNPGFPVSSGDSYAALDVDSFQLRRSRRAKKTNATATERNGGKIHDNTTGQRKVQKGRRRNHSLDLDSDMVMVPSDYFSGSESEGSDWSVGWFEPHAPEFCSDTEPENSFAVLVPCYGAPSPDCFGRKGRFGQEDNPGPHSNSKSQLWAAVLSNLAKDSHADTNFYLQQWVSSLQT